MNAHKKMECGRAQAHDEKRGKNARQLPQVNKPHSQEEIFISTSTVRSGAKSRWTCALPHTHTHTPNTFTGGEKGRAIHHAHLKGGLGSRDTLPPLPSEKHTTQVGGRNFFHTQTSPWPSLADVLLLCW